MRFTSRGIGFAIGVLLMMLAAGCAPRTFEPNVDVLSDGQARIPDWSDLGLVLDRVVVGREVDYARLLEDPQPLNRFLAKVAQAGPATAPDRFPDRNSRLAYAINCYNAVILRSIVALADGGTLPRHAPANLEARFRFRIDGRLQRPADLRKAAEALAGNDWRVRFALCDGRRGGPPLSRRVFLADILDAQLDHATRAALAAPQIVTLDHGASKRLLLWGELYALRHRLIRDYERRLKTSGACFLNVLLEWSDRPRRSELNSAVGYGVAQLPFDGAINALQPSPEEDRGVFALFESLSFLKP